MANCGVCSKKIDPKKGYILTQDGHFCGDDCFHKWQTTARGVACLCYLFGRDMCPRHGMELSE